MNYFKTEGENEMIMGGGGEGEGDLEAFDAIGGDFDGANGGGDGDGDGLDDYSPPAANAAPARGDMWA